MYIDDEKKINLLVSRYSSSGTGAIWCYDRDSDDFVAVPFEGYATHIVDAVISSSVLSGYGGYSRGTITIDQSVNKDMFDYLIAHV